MTATAAPNPPSTRPDGSANGWARDSAAERIAAAGGAEGWPERLDPNLALMLVDQEMIQRLEAQSAAEIATYQAKRARALIAHAKAASPAWRERLPAALDGRPWSATPQLTREAFRAISAQGPLPLPSWRGAVRPNATTGSSGVPIGFHTDAFAARMNMSNSFHMGPRQGLADGKATAIITVTLPEHEGEHVAVLGHPMLGATTTYKRRARQFTIEQHARWLSALGAEHLVIGPATLGGLLDVYESGAVPAPRLAAVVTHTETVTADLRRRSRDVLGAPIRDRYSCEEAGPIAYECPAQEGRYHVCVSNVLVEVVDEEGRAARPGQPGRVLLTGLHTWASPVIRYEIGDLATFGVGCPCGYRGPVLESLLGRIRFLIRLPSGERRQVGSPARPWLEIAPFAERRIVQPSPFLIRAEVVLDRPIAEAERDAVIALLRHELGPDLSYEVVQVEAIAWAPTYKRQDVVSLI